MAVDSSLYLEISKEKLPCDYCDQKILCALTGTTCKAFRRYTGTGRFYPQHIGQQLKSFEKSRLEDHLWQISKSK